MVIMIDKIGKPGPELLAIKPKAREAANPLKSFGQVFAEKLKDLPVASNIDPDGKVFIGNSKGLSSVNISKLV